MWKWGHDFMKNVLAVIVIIYIAVLLLFAEKKCKWIDVNRYKLVDPGGPSPKWVEKCTYGIF